MLELPGSKFDTTATAAALAAVQKFDTSFITARGIAWASDKSHPIRAKHIHIVTSVCVRVRWKFLRP